MSEQTQPERRTRRPLLVLRITALAILVLSGVAFYEALRISGRSGFGPSEAGFFPFIVSVGLLLFGVAFFLRSTVLPDRSLMERAEEEEEATSWNAVGFLAVALLVYVFALGPLGYVVATTIFLPVVTRILGSRHLVRDLIVGFGMALAIYVGFTELLGVRLPGGVVELIL